MAIADIANVPQDWASLQEWSFPHMAHHIDMNAHILRTKGISIPLYPMDPLNPEDLGTFGFQHQLIHGAINKVLGISGSDLTNVDWTDEAQRAIWVDMNFSEHLQWSELTGVG